MLEMIAIYLRAQPASSIQPLNVPVPKVAARAGGSGGSAPARDAGPPPVTKGGWGDTTHQQQQQQQPVSSTVTLATRVAPTSHHVHHNQQELQQDKLLKQQQPLQQHVLAPLGRAPQAGLGPLDRKPAGASVSGPAPARGAALALEEVDDEDLDGGSTGAGALRGGGAALGHHAGPRASDPHPAGPQQVPVPSETVSLIKVLLGGPGSSGKLPDSFHQGFFFKRQSASLPYALWQEKGGPCGVLAAVQAQLVKELLEARVVPREASMQESERALAAAIAAILWRCGAHRRAAVAVLGPTGLPTAQMDFASLESLEAYVARAMTSTFRGPQGIAVLIHSAVLSRGASKVRKDGDSGEETLLGRHGYCAQELVNLLITGKAVCNVFDGSRDLDSMILKGVETRAEVRDTEKRRQS